VLQSHPPTRGNSDICSPTSPFVSRIRHRGGVCSASDALSDVDTRFLQGADTLCRTDTGWTSFVWQRSLRAPAPLSPAPRSFRFFTLSTSPTHTSTDQNNLTPHPERDGKIGNTCQPRNMVCRDAQHSLLTPSRQAQFTTQLGFFYSRHHSEQAERSMDLWRGASNWRIPDDQFVLVFFVIQEGLARFQTMVVSVSCRSIAP